MNDNTFDLPNGVPPAREKIPTGLPHPRPYLIDMINDMIRDAQKIGVPGTPADCRPPVSTNLISDGYHTFGELYAHRTRLFIALCRYIQFTDVWRSKSHSDGTRLDGYFLLGIGFNAGEQITYHLEDEYWKDCAFAATLSKAPPFDGHTPQDVLQRLANL